MTPKQTCFLIDDDVDDREIFALALADTDKNMQLFTAINCKAAIDKFVDEHDFIPDYIFLDLNMPGMNGFECLARIKEMPHLCERPVIIYSTSSNVNYFEETRRLGATHYLVKPNRIEELTRILIDIFEKKELPYVLNDQTDTYF